MTYSKYDARGYARRKQDGVHDLAFTYDRAERLTQVAQADAAGNPGTPVLTTLVYATANTTNNYKNGKLEIATAANPELTAAVVETYTYGGLGGRVSSRQTVVETRIINQAFTWNDLGQLASLGYPNDTMLADAVEPPRTVSYTYANAALTAVPSYLSSISYHSKRHGQHRDPRQRHQGRPRQGCATTWHGRRRSPCSGCRTAPCCGRPAPTRTTARAISRPSAPTGTPMTA